MPLSALTLATLDLSEIAAPTRPSAVDRIDLVDPGRRPILKQIPPLDLSMDNLQAIRSVQFPPELPAAAVQKGA